MGDGHLLRQPCPILHLESYFFRQEIFRKWACDADGSRFRIRGGDDFYIFATVGCGNSVHRNISYFHVRCGGLEGGGELGTVGHGNLRIFHVDEVDTFYGYQYFMGSPVLYRIAGVQLHGRMRIGVSLLVYIHQDIIEMIAFQFIEVFFLSGGSVRQTVTDRYPVIVLRYRMVIRIFYGDIDKHIRFAVRIFRPVVGV